MGVRHVGIIPHPPVGAGATAPRRYSMRPRKWFQSSPARGGGCNLRARHRRTILAIRFNPHPPVGAGATMDRPRDMVHPRSVSILTRPWGRVQRLRSVYGNGRSRFQSSPARGGGCNGSQTSRGVADDDSFNPHPPVGAGATGRAARRYAACAGVSILTRPWGRVQPSKSTPVRGQVSSFNPHPPVGADATRRRAGRRACSRGRFNPHPPVGAGATRSACATCIATRSFQSSPARGGGCNAAVIAGSGGWAVVSILTRPWGRVQRQV